MRSFLRGPVRGSWGNVSFEGTVCVVCTGSSKYSLLCRGLSRAVASCKVVQGHLIRGGLAFS
jgi:hypothetical protein